MACFYIMLNLLQHLSGNVNQQFMGEPLKQVQGDILIKTHCRQSKKDSQS